MVTGTGTVEGKDGSCEQLVAELAEARRRAQEFELLIKGVVDYAIIRLDLAGSIASWNRGAEHLKGWTAAEIVGSPYEAFFTPEDVAAGKPRKLLEIARTRGHVEDEGWRVRKDGSRFWADAVVTALRDDQGELVGYGKVTRDLTERRKAEELAVANAQLVASSKLKDEFMANMSHELRTPLNSIIGYTDLVLTDEEQPLSELNRANLGTVVKNARHLLSLINDVLDIAKIEAGRLTLFAQRFEPAETARAVVSMLEPLAASKNLQLSLEASAATGFIVSDETKVRQILTNLISNAIKFTRHGQIWVRVGPEDDQQCRFEVQDTGVGIAPEYRELVFEEFRQVDPTSTREAGGTGLGLAIVRRLARLLGGNITLESEIGQGSTFTVVLPRRLPEHLQAQLPEAPAGTLPAPFAAGAGKVPVLAIDDDPDALRVLAGYLKDGPYKIVAATSGESGLALARKLKPFAITLDILMPKMDGWMVLHALKADPQTAGIPVVLLSFLEEKAIGFSLGASAYLTKPLDRKELLAALDTVRTSKRAGRVLVVEDDPEARALYRQIFDRERIPYREAQNGVEALAALEEEVPAVVILDLMMPKLDGFEVLSWMRARAATRDVPVVVVTAKVLTPEDLERLSSARQVLIKGGDGKDALAQDLRALLDSLRAPSR